MFPLTPVTHGNFSTRPTTVMAIRFLDGTAEEVYAFIHQHGGASRYMSGPGQSFYLSPPGYGVWGEEVVQLGDWLVSAPGGVKRYSHEHFEREFMPIEHPNSGGF